MSRMEEFKESVTEAEADEFFRAFLARDAAYEGSFFAAIKTTGIFCRPTCGARKPKRENCEFFPTASAALHAGYRACKLCHPTQMPDAPSPILKTLMAAVEEDLSRRWRDRDVRALGIDPSTARRQFQQRFGMSFIAYARARRVGTAVKSIRQGGRVIDAQVESGFESGSGFRTAFSKLIGAPPKNGGQAVLSAALMQTPLGAMLALADEAALHLLEFTDRVGLETELLRLRDKHKFAILPGETAITRQIDAELAAYFTGSLKQFETPLHTYGSAFQQSVLRALKGIPYGETRSYKEQAVGLGRESAVRAIARANGANQLAIIIPCHRVIGSDGSLTGYAGGLARKEWLLAHERRHR